MRVRGAITFGLLIAAADGVSGQRPAAPGLPDEVPALVMPVEPPLLGNGVAVSQPLQPVVEPIHVITEVTEAPAVVPSATQVLGLRPMPSSWYRAELLLWWPKGQPVPPLVVAGRDAIPRLGAPAVSPLIGGSSQPSPDTAGGRFVVGWALSDTREFGVEFAYLFLGTHTQTASAWKPRDGRAQYLGHPFFNADSGAEDVVLIADPNSVGGVSVSTSGRVTGWEANLVRSLYDGPTVRLNGLAGYRYFMVNEGLRVESRSFGLNGVPGFAVADQFDAHNRFHGGQLGLRADVERGSFFAEVDAKIGFGRTVEVVRVSGVTAFDGGPVVPVGVYGQPSNSGRTSRAAFAVLPEAGLRMGWRLGEKSRVYVGYTLLYLSDAVRPGDQLDRVLAPSTGTFGDRPAPLFVQNDFWVQGLSLGLEWRY